MAPRYSFPDPKLRSVKKPTDDCSREKIVALYNQVHGTDRIYLTEEIKDWFRAAAIRLGWKSVVFGPNAATLTAEVRVIRQEAVSDDAGKVVPMKRIGPGIRRT